MGGAMGSHSAVIAGGGPAGLMLAAELALARVDVLVVERRASQSLEGLRALGMHARTLEVLDQRGVLERFTSQGQVLRMAPFAGATFDIGDLSTRHSYFLALWQAHIERTLADWVAELGVPIRRGTDVTGLQQDADGVDLTLSDGEGLRAQYVVGCDGGRSLVRRSAGIDFPGWDASTAYLIAEVELDETPVWGIRRNARGINAVAPLDDGKRARVVLNEPFSEQRPEPTLQDVRFALNSLYGTDFGLRSASSISRFTDMTRQAASYRVGRVLLAGDAAHVHSPVGGQGLSLGMQDAVNLGWKLAQVVHGTSPDSLLDTYHAERHPVAARVLRNTRALTALERGDDGSDALRDMLTELLDQPDTRRQYFAMASGLDTRYDLGEGHPLIGRRMPDLDLRTAEGALRVSALLHGGRPVLLKLGNAGALDIAPWADRVRVMNATCDERCELPGFGEATVPGCVLIRPDGHVAWVGNGASERLVAALTTWFGPPAGQ